MSKGASGYHKTIIYRNFAYCNEACLENIQSCRRSAAGACRSTSGIIICTALHAAGAKRSTRHGKPRAFASAWSTGRYRRSEHTSVQQTVDQMHPRNPASRSRHCRLDSDCQRRLRAIPLPAQRRTDCRLRACRQRALQFLASGQKFACKSRRDTQPHKKRPAQRTAPEFIPSQNQHRDTAAFQSELQRSFRTCA